MAHGSNKNFYAVKRGRKPGIYRTWSECEENVKGYSGAIFKGFETYEEARSFMGKRSSAKKADSTTGKKKAKNSIVPIVSEKAPVSQTGVESFSKAKPIRQLSGYIRAPHPGSVFAKAKEAGMLYGSGKMGRSTLVDALLDSMQRAEVTQERNRVCAAATNCAVIESRVLRRGTYEYGVSLMIGSTSVLIRSGGRNPGIASMGKVAGEILGSMAAIRKAQELGCTSLVLSYDCEETGNWAEAGYKIGNVYASEYSAFVESAKKVMDLSFEQNPLQVSFFA